MSCFESQAVIADVSSRHVVRYAAVKHGAIPQAIEKIIRLPADLSVGQQMPLRLPPIHHAWLLEFRTCGVALICAWRFCSASRAAISSGDMSVPPAVRWTVGSVCGAVATGLRKLGAPNRLCPWSAGARAFSFCSVPHDLVRSVALTPRFTAHVGIYSFLLGVSFSFAILA